MDAVDLMGAGLAVALVNLRRTLGGCRRARALLDELVGRRGQLVAMRATESVRLQQTSGNAVVASLVKHLRPLGPQVHELERRITKMVEDDDDRRGKARLQNVPGSVIRGIPWVPYPT